MNRKLFWICIVLLSMLLLCTRLDAQTGDYSGGWGSSWSSIGDSWHFKSSYRKITGYRAKPKEIGSLDVEVLETKLGKFGHHFQVSGRVDVVTGEVVKPVDWFQGITVHLAHEPEKKCDWSSGISADAVSDHVILQNDGTFEVKFDLRETRRNPKQAAAHQIAIALATHDANKTGDAQKVVWESKDPAVRDTVRMLDIPASLEIARELRLIDMASGWPFSDPDGAKLIRAVNALRPLGKKRALELLRGYTASLHDAFDDGDVVFWIIRILFEPANLRKQIPSPAIAVSFDSGDKGNLINKDSILWPLDPIELSHDVPFMLGRPIGMGGRPEHPSSHIAWATRFGVIRETPLAPFNPLLAAERLLSSKKLERLQNSEWDDRIDRVREQAVVMSKAMELPEYRETISDAQWKKLLKSAAAQKVWDAGKQEWISK